MRSIDIYGANYAGHSAHERAASRGILLRGDDILLSRETAVGQWMIPGGGVEAGETPEACCVREMAEETGVLVRPERCFLTLNEHYEDWKYVTHYFACAETGTAERRPTERERAVGAEPAWIPLKDALAIFSRHADWAATDEERRGIYLREYRALTEWIRQSGGDRGSLPAFDNHDSRIRYWELLLEGDITGLAEQPLPAGYHYGRYCPGDRDAWIAIERSAKEFDTCEEGLAAWERYFGGHDGELAERMCFVVNERGEKVATASAWRDVTGRDTSGAGWLHWVAVRREDQGRGLSKPLITHVLGIMRDLGQTRAKIPTQTTTWLAVRVYLDLGFRPIPANAVHSRMGWQIVRRLTDHPALAGFEPAADADVLAEGENV